MKGYASKFMDTLSEECGGSKELLLATYPRALNLLDFFMVNIVLECLGDSEQFREVRYAHVYLIFDSYSI